MTDAEIAALYARAFPLDASHWSAPMIGSFRAGRNSHILGDEDAILMVTEVADQAEIVSLFVEPAAQGKGKGRGLLTKWFAHLTELGIREVYLEVAKDNTRAVSFYDVLGFHRVGQRKNYYKRRDGSKVDAILMSKLL